MINLLPPEEKRELILKKKNRIIIILGFVFVFFLICLTLVLFSVKIFLLGENVIQKQRLDEVSKDYNSASLTLAAKDIKEYNKTLDGLDYFYKNQIYVNDALKSFLNISMPKGVYLINVLVARKTENSVTIDVYGFSDSRDNLLVFKSNVEKEKLIKNPIFSQDSWVKSQNVNFYLTFQYGDKN